MRGEYNNWKYLLKCHDSWNEMLWKSNWSSGVWLEISSVKCESPERGPPGWDLNPGTQLLAEEFVDYLAPQIFTASPLTWTENDKETSLLSEVKIFPPPSKGAWEGYMRGTTDEKVQRGAWHQLASFSFWLLPWPPARQKLARRLNLQRFVYHEHDALCFQMATDI